MSDTTSLLIPYAASTAEGCQQALQGLALPHLDRLLARLSPHTAQTDTGEETSFTPPHERALARALGLPFDDGRTPWAAWHRHQQGLRTHKGRSADHVGVLPGLGQRARHIGQGRALGRKNLDVRDHAEHAVAHLFLKAVHHTQHDDERRHPERNAQHGHARDERDEAVAPRGAPRARVAPAQGQFVGNLHGLLSLGELQFRGKPLMRHATIKNRFTDRPHPSCRHPPPFFNTFGAHLYRKHLCQPVEFLSNFGCDCLWRHKCHQSMQLALS